MVMRPGQIIANQFRLERPLASGGMGSVYLAEQVGVGRRVAIKVMHAEIESGMSNAAERFRREAMLAAQLNHPNIVQLYTFGQTEQGDLYLAMEYVRGQSLEELLLERGRLPELRVLRIAHQICDALEHAHRAGVVHRDLKPANIMLTQGHSEDDSVKVLDFGIAKPVGTSERKLTATNVIVGTPRYMSPEHARGLATDARSDIYALGCVLYHLLGGEPPFDSDSPTDLIVRHVTEPPEPLTRRFPGLGLRSDIEQVIQKCLQKDPALRHQSARALQSDLQRALQAGPSERVRAAAPMYGGPPPPPQPESTARFPASQFGNVRTTQNLPSHVQHPPASFDSLAVPRAATARPRSSSRTFPLVLGGAILALGAGGYMLAGLVSPSSQLPQLTSSLPQLTGALQRVAVQDFPNQKLWKAYEAVRDVQEDCVEDYFRGMPLAGPTRGKREYVRGVCPSTDLPTAKGLVQELAQEPLQRALPLLEQACQACGEAYMYYETGSYEKDSSERGRALHASMLATTKAYLPVADQTEAWAQATVCGRMQQAQREREPTSLGHRFRALVVTGCESTAATDVAQLTAANAKLEQSMKLLAESTSTLTPQIQASFQGLSYAARELLKHALQAQQLATGEPLPKARKGYKLSATWREVAEPKPTPLQEARRLQATLLEALIKVAIGFEELEQRNLLR